MAITVQGPTGVFQPSYPDIIDKYGVVTKMFTSSFKEYFTSSGAASYNVNKSLRFRSSASAYLNRTPATTTNQKTWTWSGWVKRGILGSSTQELFTGTSSGNFTGVRFIADQLYVQDYLNGSYNIYWVTNAVYRDPAAWYHVVVNFDTTQASSANAVSIWINGALQTATFQTALGGYVQNRNGYINTGSLVHYVSNGVSSAYFDGEMAEINFVDGQALAPTAFGAYSIYNQWLPIKYAGTYGTNGFYLPFTNTTSTSTLVADSSGNANNWTPNNISLTAGSTYDSLTDVPTLTSETVANYAVLNPLYRGYGGYTATPVTISNANLTIAGNASANNIAATFALPTAGNFYWEYVWTANSGGEMDGGIIGESGTPYFYRYDGTYFNGSTYVAYGSSYTTSDVIGVSVNMTNRTFTFYKNNVSQGTTAAFPSGVTYFPWFYVSNTVGANVNFGQQPFTYTAPTGFLPLNTFNI